MNAADVVLVNLSSPSSCYKVPVYGWQVTTTWR